MTASPGVPAPSGGPPKEYRITAHALVGGSAVAVAGTTSIDLDTTWGGTPTGLPGPADMLATAFAACLLKNLARSGALLAFSYEEAHVEVIARHQDSPPKFTEISYRLQVVTDETGAPCRALNRNPRSYGTVYNTLAGVCEVHGEMVPVPTPTR